MAEPILKVRDLTVRYGAFTVIEGVSFDLGAGETLGIVGESGSGKSTVAQSILRLNELMSGARLSGEILFNGQDVLALPEATFRRMRGRDVAIIFQDPMTALDPVMTVGAQIAEAIAVHDGRADAARVAAALAEVGLPDPDGIAARFPHELSGGMQQRVVIAMALVHKPALLLADEPTTALDVTVQAQILDLLARLRAERGMSIIFITHDLGALAQLADRVMVMYAGGVVETGSAEAVYRNPAMPYTADLLASTPRPGDRERPLLPIPGSQPGPGERPPGCRYAPRCRHRAALCDTRRPALVERRSAQVARCHFGPAELGLAQGATDR